MVGPRIRDESTGRFEVGKIPRDDRHAMRQGACRDERISLGTRVGHMQSGAAKRHGRINRESSFCEFRQDMIFYPSA